MGTNLSRIDSANLRPGIERDTLPIVRRVSHATGRLDDNRRESSLFRFMEANL